MNLESPIIKIVELSKFYGKSTIPSLDRVNLTINRGEKFGIFGPNGAGKTTLISILCNILTASKGTVEYTIEENKQNMHAILNMIGFVPQDFAFYPDLTAQQNLSYFGGIYGISADEVKSKSTHLLEILGLSSVAHQKVRSFSGGMKRRLNLAIGLIHSPKVLFLDEPTVGIDIHSKLTIMSLLEKLNKSGTTVIYTSHHLKEAEDFCSRVALIDNGKIIALGSIDELVKQNDTLNLEELMIKLTGKELRD